MVIERCTGEGREIAHTRRYATLHNGQERVREDCVPSELHSTVTAYPAQPAFSSSSPFLLHPARDTRSPRAIRTRLLLQNRVILFALVDSDIRRVERALTAKAAVTRLRFSANVLLERTR